MDIGIVKNLGENEHRVPITPAGAESLVADGHRLFVESGTGRDCRFDDLEYRDVGAEIVYSHEEVFRRGRLILGVRTPDPADVAFMDQGQILCGFLHLTVAPRDLLRSMIDRKVTAVGYELIQDKEGRTPILGAIGELAGQMVVHIAAHLLQNESGGRGILLGGIAENEPANALVLGAGSVGKTAARFFVSSGANVTLVDCDPNTLISADRDLQAQAKTCLADPETVARLTRDADVVIGAIRIPGERAPYLVTREMVAQMRPGSVIIDVAIDQGGCVETSRPTTLKNPTFLVNDVVHYCVPNLTANIARTASKILTQTHLPYVRKIAATGRVGKDGVYLENGVVRFAELAEHLGS
ncbi:MAG: alanine dehydrogenase [Pseudomonadota bacterium]